MSAASPHPQHPATPYGPPQVPPPPKPGRGKQIAINVAVGLFCLVLGAAMGGGGANSTDAKATPAPTVTVTATAAVTQSPPRSAPTVTVTKTVTASPVAHQPAATVPGDGTYLVGTDMAAGTWKTAGTNGILCYWERDKDATGNFSSIIANDTITGTGRVTVFKGETFKSKGCEDWTKVG